MSEDFKYVLLLKKEIEKKLISEFVKLLDNMLYASEEDLKEIIEVAKEEYEEKLK